MAKKTKIVENSNAEVKSAILNEMDEIGPGEMPQDVEKNEEKEKE